MLSIDFTAVIVFLLIWILVLILSLATVRVSITR